MAKVVAPEGFALELDGERMTFGHSTDIEVPLLPDLGVAERQFTIVRFGDTHFIEHSADPLAPTRVNGAPITKHSLRNGDEISAGELVLVFQDDSAEPVESSPDLPNQKAEIPCEETVSSDELAGPEELVAARLLEFPPASAPTHPTAPELPAARSEEAPITDKTKADLESDSGSDSDPKFESEPPKFEPRGLPPIPPIPAAEHPTVSLLQEAAPLTPAPGLALPAAPANDPLLFDPTAEGEADAENPDRVAESSEGEPELPIASRLPGAAEGQNADPSTRSIPPAELDPPAKPDLPPSDPSERVPPSSEESTGSQSSESTLPALLPDGLPDEPASPIAGDSEPVGAAPEAAAPEQDTEELKAAAAITSPRGDTPSTANMVPEAPLEIPVSVEIEQEPVESVREEGRIPPLPLPSATVSLPKEAAAIPAPAAEFQPTPPTLPTPPPPLPEPQTVEHPAIPIEPPQPAVSPPPARPVSASAVPAPDPATFSTPESSTPPAPADLPTTAIAPDPAADAIAGKTAETAETAGAETPSKPKRRKKAKKARSLRTPKIKRPRAPLFPFLRVAIPGAITLAALLGGVYYAWENYFKTAAKPLKVVYQKEIPSGFSSAEVNAPDILRYLPQDAEMAVYIDAQTGYDVWSATMNPDGEPVYNPIDEFVRESTGVGLEQLDYLCIAGDAGVENFVALVGFNTELDPAELYNGIERAGSRLVRVETIGERPLRILNREGIDFELLMVDPKTVVLSSLGRMRSAVGNSEHSASDRSPAISSLGTSISDEAAFVVAGIPDAIGLGQIFDSLGCPAPAAFLDQVSRMDSIRISAIAHSDIELSISFEAADPQLGANLLRAGDSWLKAMPDQMRKRFGEKFAGGTLPVSIDSVLEGARWESAGQTSHIRIRVPRGAVPDLIRALEPQEEDQAAIDRSIRDAQNLASLFATGVSCGNPELPEAGSVENAIELLITGVGGRENFASMEIRFPFRPDQEELEAISRHLRWQDNLLVYVPSI